MLSPIQSGTSRPIPQVSQTSFDLRICVSTIIQVAIRIFFVLAVILMTAVIIPQVAYGIVLPLVGMGAATIASFFSPPRLIGEQIRLGSY